MSELQLDEKKSVSLDDKHLDDTQTIYEDKEKANNLSPELIAAEKSLIRKLDFIYVMPCIAVLNFLQFFDKSALNYSNVLGIKTDTHIDDKQFSWLGSIFYLGYLIYQVPNTYFIQRLPIGKYIGTLIVIWGVVLTVTCLAKNFAQLAALRFLLGFFEAGIYPCCIMIISSLYRRKEQAGRIGFVYICNGIAMAIGGLIGYGIGHMMGVRGMNAWQWIMIILGAATITFGIFCFFLLADNPDSKLLHLTPEQKTVVHLRTLDNATVITKQIKFHHMLESLKEPRYYCFIFASLLFNLQNGALNTFSAVITAGFGFSNLNAILLTVPSGVVDCIYIVFAIWYNRRYGQTLHLACILLGVTILGLILLIVIPLPQVKLLGLYMCWAFCASYVLFLTSIANNVSGYTKKIFYSSSVMVFYTVGNFAGPQMMVAEQKPLYLGGMIGYIAADAICIILLQIARYYMDKSNKERIETPSSDKVHVAEDLTDREDPHFIYRL
ncbi:major facilitator superfamily domain-containing protein [Cokeromyces recurvatus]|uniref:major facilitator superfamily domain-containing protein n=1 Tax=Cokeromyces recurvatus TaxID=90255 RepID=UPI00221F05CC|nr:major facilitator superfamily domain-containing protein [Cokeromyces recurvatus]KAI7906634.1 major facilitator superfamily domain-containing protein [Cokeromyces recurvatus]